MPFRGIGPPVSGPRIQPVRCISCRPLCMWLGVNHASLSPDWFPSQPAATSSMWHSEQPQDKEPITSANQGSSPGRSLASSASLRVPALFFRDTAHRVQSMPLFAMLRSQDATLEGAKFQSPALKQVLDAQRLLEWPFRTASSSAIHLFRSGSLGVSAGGPSLYDLPNISRPSLISLP